MVLYASNCGQQNYTMSGVLELIQTRNNQISFKKNSERVLVVVYKTSTNHFAVIYPIWGLDCSRKPICKINLLSTKIDKSVTNPDKEFSIVSTRESVSFEFRIPEKCLKDNYTSDDWIQALSNNNEKSSFLKPSTSIYKSRQIRLNLSVLNEESNEEND